MKFYSQISQDERDDWRKIKATELAMEMLSFRAADLEGQALRLLHTAEFTKAQFMAGQAEGIRDALSLMERDR